jgi:hypothetical protein
VCSIYVAATIAARLLCKQFGDVEALRMDKDGEDAPLITSQVMKHGNGKTHEIPQ